MTEDLLAKAIEYATEKHKGQKYGNKPYITHPLAVLERVKKNHSFVPTLCAAVLHDVVEDCGVSLNEIEKEFGYMVRGILAELTHMEHESYAEYIAGIRRNREAEIVKIADLEENISNCKSPKQKHLKDKYELALLYLKK